MLDAAGYQMGASLCFLKHPTVAISACLLMLIFSSRYISTPSSVILTLLALLLPTSFQYLFSKIRQLREASSNRKPMELDVGLELLPQDEASEEKKPVVGDRSNTEDQAFEPAYPSPGSRSAEREGINAHQVSVADASCYGNKVVPEINLSCSPSEISDFSPFDYDDSSRESNVHQLTECSEDSISDDDGLIEITLPDGHYVAPGMPNDMSQPGLRGGFLPNFSPESLFRQHGLTELLSEIYEEDNMIEIDITRGSIKCPSLEIEA